MPTPPTSYEIYMKHGKARVLHAAPPKFIGICQFSGKPLYSKQLTDEIVRERIARGKSL